MAAANSAGGVMGKMISLTSIAVAAAATTLKREDESLLFRFTLKHSLILTAVLALIVMFFAYVSPAGWGRCSTPGWLCPWPSTKTTWRRPMSGSLRRSRTCSRKRWHIAARNRLPY